MHIPLQYIDDYTMDDFNGIIQTLNIDSKTQGGKSYQTKPSQKELNIAKKLRQRRKEKWLKRIR